MPSSGMSALQSLLGVLWAALAGCVDLPFRESSFTNRTRFSWPCSPLLPPLIPPNRSSEVHPRRELVVVTGLPKKTRMTAAELAEILEPIATFVLTGSL